MRHVASPDFWKWYHQLPRNVRVLADKSFRLLKRNASHPSLHLKKVGALWSVRVGAKHRALAVEEGDALVWYWIGKHDEYERQIAEDGNS